MSVVAASKRPSTRVVYIWIMGVGICFGGVAFVFKIVEFMRTLNSPEVAGFVVVPVAVYFAVAAGFVCLFGWAWLSGHFQRIEEPKYAMLERELEYEQLEEQGIDP